MQTFELLVGSWLFKQESLPGVPAASLADVSNRVHLARMIEYTNQELPAYLRVDSFKGRLYLDDNCKLSLVRFSKIYSA